MAIIESDLKKKINNRRALSFEDTKRNQRLRRKLRRPHWKPGEWYYKIKKRECVKKEIIINKVRRSKEIKIVIR